MKKIFLLLVANFSLTAAPKSVVFDFGGVMTGEIDQESIALLDAFEVEGVYFKTALHNALKMGVRYLCCMR